jgi:hypothetical protein
VNRHTTHALLAFGVPFLSSAHAMFNENGFQCCMLIRDCLLRTAANVTKIALDLCCCCCCCCFAAGPGRCCQLLA